MNAPRGTLALLASILAVLALAATVVLLGRDLAAAQQQQQHAANSPDPRYALEGESAKQYEKRMEFLSLPRVDGVVIFKSLSAYKQHVLSKFRSYDTVAVMSATAKVGCKNCEAWEEAFAEVAKAYDKAIESNPKKRELFFARVRYEDAHDVFGYYSLSHAPQMIYIPSEHKVEGKGVDGLKPSSQFILQLSHQEYVLPETIIEFIKSRAGISINIYSSPWIRVGILAVVLVAVMSVFQMLALHLVPLLRRKKWVWFLVSSMAFALGASGTIYAYLRNSPNYGYDSKTRRYTYFAGDRNQYAFEGYIVGGLLVVSGLSLIISANINIPGNIGKALNPVLSVGALALFCVLFREYVRLYTNKAGWYAYGMRGTSNFASVWVPGK